MHAISILFGLTLSALAQDGATLDTPPRSDGYRGIWYYNQPSNDEYKYKYSGGFATYPQQIAPFAIYSREAGKTFFTFGGVSEDGSLLHLVSYFDHETKTVPRPAILLDKKTQDAHDNPAIQIDARGHLWIFSNAHGTARSAFISRSMEPYSIDRFEQVLETNFSYSQPWFLEGRGFCFLHTRYGGGRRLYCQTSPNGRDWTEPTLLAAIERGHYQVSWERDGGVGTAFNFHPQEVGLNARTNLYYMQTRDGGRTWQNVQGRSLELPLTDIENPVLVREFQGEGRLVYLKTVQFTSAGHPVIVFLTSGGYEAGPKNDPRQWMTARWTGEEWVFHDITRSTHNYDFGSLYLEADDQWRLIAPTEAGPQPFSAGGEIAMWISRDQGESWTKTKQLTKDSPRNHTYVRHPVNAHPDFYALWADGNGLERSESRLYFTDREGTAVWQLPVKMSKATEPAVRLK
ncbi:MAG: BNR-4 repeat-containing protein [Planctomycetota bacterium]